MRIWSPIWRLIIMKESIQKRGLIATFRKNIRIINLFRRKCISLLCILALLTCASILILHYALEESEPLFIEIDPDDVDNLTNAYNNEEQSNPLSLLEFAPKCRDMFYDGSLVRPDHWETPACKSLDYTWGELKSCLWKKNSKHHIALIGDSRMRQLANMFVNYMKNTTTPTLLTRFHEDTFFEEQSLNLKISYFWQTFIDKKLARRFSSWIRFNCSDVPDMVLIGVGAWYMSAEAEKLKHIAPQVLSKFEAGLWKLSRLMKTLSRHVPIIWVGQAPAYMLWRPDGSFRNITAYNAAAEKILNQTGVTYWKSAHTIGDQMFHQSPDVNHYSDNTTKALVNVVWNFYCNSKISISSDHCCVTPND